MKSRITVEIDYDNNNQPIIQILARNSEDIRDGLIKSFYQTLGGSSWCKILFRQDELGMIGSDGQYHDGFKRIFITPIPDRDLKKEAEVMLEQHRVNDEWAKNNQK